MEEIERTRAGCGSRHGSGGPSRHVLLVEDELELAETLQCALEEAGLRVSVLDRGDRALAAYSEERPDCVVLDLMLPGRNGFDVCQAIKRTSSPPPVIVLTGIDAGDSRELARRVGADGYLVKPIDPARLIAEIQSAIQQKGGPATSEADCCRPSAHTERVMLRCRCGRRFHVSAIHRGQKLPCPTCGDSLAVPTLDNQRG